MSIYEDILMAKFAVTKNLDLKPDDLILRMSRSSYDKLCAEMKTYSLFNPTTKRRAILGMEIEITADIEVTRR